jgi:hypothetical protein
MILPRHFSSNALSMAKIAYPSKEMCLTNSVFRVVMTFDVIEGGLVLSNPTSFLLGQNKANITPGMKWLLESRHKHLIEYMDRE